MKQTTFKLIMVLAVAISCFWGGHEVGKISFYKDPMHRCIWREIKDSHVEQIGRMEQERVAENAQFFDDQWKREIAIMKDCERAIAAACARLTNALTNSVKSGL